MFLEKCKYVIKEKKIKNIFDDIEMPLDSSYEETPDEEILKKILTKKMKYNNFSGFSVSWSIINF